MIDTAEQIEHLKLAAQVAGLDGNEIVLPEDREMTVGNMRLHYLDWGTAGRPRIIFLHGGALNAHTWDLVCLTMRSDYHCMALDQRGHGDSGWADDYTIEGHLQDITGFIDQLGMDRFVLVGQSMGGMNSIAYAGRNPHRLTALVIVDVGPELKIDGTRKIGDFVRQGSPDGESLEAIIERAMEFNPRRHPTLLRRSLMHNLRKLPNGKWTWKWDPGRMRASHHDIKEHLDGMRRLWHDVEKIACPTLVMRGANSDVFSDENAQKLAENLTNGRWERVDNAGHTIQGDNPRAMVGLLREFLGEIDY